MSITLLSGFLIISLLVLTTGSHPAYANNFLSDLWNSDKAKPILVNTHNINDSGFRKDYSLNGKFYRVLIKGGEVKVFEEKKDSPGNFQPIVEPKLIASLKKTAESDSAKKGSLLKSPVSQLEIYQKIPVTNGKLVPGHHLIHGRFLVEVTDDNKARRLIDTQGDALYYPIEINPTNIEPISPMSFSTKAEVDLQMIQRVAAAKVTSPRTITEDELMVGLPADAKGKANWYTVKGVSFYLS